MKKIITLVLIIGLVAPLVTGAQGIQEYSTSKVPGERTFVGVIDSINANEKSFVLRIGESVSLFQRFVAALFPSRGYIAPKYQVVTSENTLFKKKTTTGVAEANFNDLVVSQRVQVKGIYERLSTTNSQNNILGIITANYVFILSPVTTISETTSSSVVSTTSTATPISSTTTASTATPISSTTTVSTVKTINCIPKCYTVGGQALGWAWICKNPVTNIWEWSRDFRGSVTLIKIDKVCKNCSAKCLYEGTPKEGYYSSCNNRLIVSGCKPPMGKTTIPYILYP